MSKTALLFPGQGAQAVGMGAELAASHPEARQLYDRANEVLGYDLAKLCFEGPVEELDSTVHSQPGLFVTSLAALEVMKKDRGDTVESCAAAAGLSLGEYTALVFAGVMEFEDALKVVQRRGEAMQAAANLQPSGMVSLLGLERDKVEEIVEQARGEQVLRVANFLCPGNIVVSGNNEACSRAKELAEAADAMKVIPLAVAGAFHTSLMDPAVEQLKEALENVTMSAPRIPVISNVDAVSHNDPEEIRQLLIRQVVSPVRWEDSMRNLLDQGFDDFYEVGPGRVLRGLLRRIDRKKSCENISA